MVHVIEWMLRPTPAISAIVRVNAHPQSLPVGSKGGVIGNATIGSGSIDSRSAPSAAPYLLHSSQNAPPWRSCQARKLA